MERRNFVKLVGAAGVAGLAGCGGGPSEDTTGSTPTATPEEDGDGGTTGTATAEPTATPTPTNVGIVYGVGGLGDGSFNDQAQQGLFQARDEFNISFQQAQPEETSEFKTFQRQFAQSSAPDFDLICCIGFQQTDSLKETSSSFPDQKFMIVDSVVEASNVDSFVFKEHEGSFLVGHLAGLLSGRQFEAGGGATLPDQKTVGFVGGVEIDLIKKFQAGYEAGVKKADDGIEVLTNYTGSFNDPAAGKTAANAMYNNGADVVYHASGNTGTGVFQAAQEQGRFAIGVDRDQSVTKPSFQDVIVASMIKRVDTPVFKSIEDVIQGDFEGGAINALGLGQDGHEVAYGQSLDSDVPGEVKDAVSQSKQAIIDGEQSVPTDPSNV